MSYISKEVYFRRKSGHLQAIELSLRVNGADIVFFIDVKPKDVFPPVEVDELEQTPEYQAFKEFVEEEACTFVSEETSVIKDELKARFLPKMYEIYLYRMDVDYDRFEQLPADFGL